MAHIFWISILALFYTYFGYPLYVFLRARSAKNHVNKDMGYKPFVSIVMSAHNEERAIEKKVINLLHSDYPEDKIEILAGSDGSTDNTNNILSRIAEKRVRVFIFPARRGKASVLNDLVEKARGEVIVFCDVRQAFSADAISHLAANFADGSVGCVSGELILKDENNSTGVSHGVGVYWNYEKFIRKNESAFNSIVGATGAIYAIRKSMYSPPPRDIILDDVYIPLAIAKRGLRCICDEEAKAFDAPAEAYREEYRRKTRTHTGNYQIFMIFKELFIPFRSKVAMPLFSHKLMRILSPFFLILLFMSNIALAKNGPYGLFLVCQAVFYIFAMIGWATHKDRSTKMIIKFAYTLYMFCVMNLTAIVGFYRFLFGKQSIAWEK